MYLRVFKKIDEECSCRNWERGNESCCWAPARSITYKNRKERRRWRRGEKHMFVLVYNFIGFWKKKQLTEYWLSASSINIIIGYNMFKERKAVTKEI